MSGCPAIAPSPLYLLVLSRIASTIMPTLKLRRVPKESPAAIPDEVVSAAVPDQIHSAAANAASATVPDQVVSYSQPSAIAANGGDGRRKKRRRKVPSAVEETSAKEASVRSGAEAAASNGDEHHVGIENPTGNKLIAKWNLRYGELIEFKGKQGNCLVPHGYGPNKQLGWWVGAQRQQYRLLRQGRYSPMTPERIAKLEEIGFVWDASHLSPNQPNSVNWHQRYSELIEYKQKHGDCDVPQLYQPNRPLGLWVSTQRQNYRLMQQGKKSQITEDRITKLDEIGFVWNASHLSPRKVDDEAWNQRYHELVEYKEKHGDCLVSKLDEANKELGRWVMTQRQHYRFLQQGKKSWITEERILKLEEIGFKWKVRG